MNSTRLLEDTATESHESGGEHENAIQIHVILFMFVALLCGQVLKLISHKFSFPYTPLITILGIIFGYVAQYLGNLGEGIESWASIDPHVIMMVFLPALIFESAFNADWHTFKIELYQILMMAGPLLIACTGLTALVMKYILRYDGEFTFTACLLFGAIASATDPVAVVALMKELGASRRLATLIEGESLLNDGTAMVVFLVVLDFVKGEGGSVGEIFGQFCRLSMLAPLIGIAFGAVATYWLKFTHDDILEVNLTIITAYLCFYVCEQSGVHTSGILALVALGLYMTNQGKTRISHSAEASVHHIWSFLGFVAETIIFTLAGLIMGARVLKSEVIQWQDWLKLLALYVILHFVRFLVLFCSWPLLRRLGYGMNFRQVVLLSFAGLRGAVGLTLALIVANDLEINKEIREIILFHTAGLAFLTILVNGNLTGKVIRALGLSRTSLVKKKLMVNILDSIESNVDHLIEELQEKKHFNLIKFPKLKQNCNMSDLKKLVEKYENVKIKRAGDSLASHQVTDQMAPESIVPRHQQTLKIDQNDLLIEIRHKFLTTLKGTYWHYFEEGQMMPQTIILLTESVDRAIDHEESDIQDWEFIQGYTKSGWLSNFMGVLERWPLIGNFFQRQLFGEFTFQYDVIVNYIEAHELTQNLLMGTMPPMQELQTVINESKFNMVKADKFMLNDIEEVFPEISRAIQYRRGAFFILNHQEFFVNELFTKGQIDEKEHKFLGKNIRKRLNELEIHPPKIKAVNTREDICEHSELTKLFGPEEMHKLIDNDESRLARSFTLTTGREHMYNEDQVIFGYGEKVTKLYFVERGAVVEKSESVSEDENIKFKSKRGSVVGLQYLACDFNNESIATAIAHGTSHTGLVEIEIEPMREMIERDPVKLVTFWKIVLPRVIKLMPKIFPKLSVWNRELLIQFVNSCEMEYYKTGDTISVANGAIIAAGTAIMFDDLIEDQVNEAQQDFEKHKFSPGAKRLSLNRMRTQAVSIRVQAESKAPMFMYPDNASTYMVQSQFAVVMHFPEEMRESWIGIQENALEAFSMFRANKSKFIRKKANFFQSSKMSNLVENRGVDAKGSITSNMRKKYSQMSGNFDMLNRDMVYKDMNQIEKQKMKAINEGPRYGGHVDIGGLQIPSNIAHLQKGQTYNPHQQRQRLLSDEKLNKIDDQKPKLGQFKSQKQIPEVIIENSVSGSEDGDSINEGKFNSPVQKMPDSKLFQNEKHK